MAEIDWTLVVMLVVALAGFLSVWFANGHLARKLEKQKKIFDMKLDVYTRLAKALDAYGWSISFREDHDSFKKSITEIEPSEILKESMNLLRKAEISGSLLSMLKRSLGMSDPDDWSLRFTSEEFYGVGHGDTKKLKPKEVIDKLHREWQRQFIASHRCDEVNTNRIKQGLSAVRIVGSMELAEMVENLASKFIGTRKTEPRMLRTRVDEALSELSKDLKATLK